MAPAWSRPSTGNRLAFIKARCGLSPAQGENPMKIFISYRRDDGGHAGRLQARLAREFGEDAVFFDLNTIEPGERFADKIREAAASSHVLLAVIGPRWLAPEADGKRRLDDPEDYVRAEIASALKQGVRVIPVLVQDAPVPRAEDLPD